MNESHEESQETMTEEEYKKKLQEYHEKLKKYEEESKEYLIRVRKENDAQFQEACKSELEISKIATHWLLTFAGGSIGLSITFVDKLAPNPHFWTIIVLGISWLLLLLSVVFSFLAQGNSQESFRLYRELLNKQIKSLNEKQKDLEPEEMHNPYIEKTLFKGKVSLWTFIVGLCLLGIFCLGNYPQEKHVCNTNNGSQEQIRATTVKQNPQTQKPSDISIPVSGSVNLQINAQNKIKHDEQAKE